MRAVARDVGISASYLGAIENGRNPTTGRAPTPSPVVLAAIARVLDLDLGVLLGLVGATSEHSSHQLVYQLGDTHRSALPTARRLLGGAVGAWVEITDPRQAATDDAPDAVVLRERGPYGVAPVATRNVDAALLIDEVAELVRRASGLVASVPIGVVFGANSALLRMADNPDAVLRAEATWDDDLGRRCRLCGVEPVTSVCVYREADLQELSWRLDPLATVIRLLVTHPRVAVETPDGLISTGPAANEAMLASVRPPGVSETTWTSLAHAAALGFARHETLASNEGIG